MTCPLSILILAVLMFIQGSRHASLTEDGNRIEQAMENPLTSHILDTTTGRPAENVRIILYKSGENGQWDQIVQKSTNKDGRVGNLIRAEDFVKGLYKLNFDTKAYYEALKMKTFYPYVEIVFEVEKPQEHYHVPLLLSPYGYSTYRGS